MMRIRAWRALPRSRACFSRGCHVFPRWRFDCARHPTADLAHATRFARRRTRKLRATRPKRSCASPSRGSRGAGRVTSNGTSAAFNALSFLRRRDSRSLPPNPTFSL